MKLLILLVESVILFAEEFNTMAEKGWNGLVSLNDLWCLFCYAVAEPSTHRCTRCLQMITNYLFGTYSTNSCVHRAILMFGNDF